jgi:hypothetical protein
MGARGKLGNLKILFPAFSKRSAEQDWGRHTDFGRILATRINRLQEGHAGPACKQPLLLARHALS